MIMKYENSSNLLQVKVFSAKTNYESNLYSQCKYVHQEFDKISLLDQYLSTLHYNSISTTSGIDNFEAYVFQQLFLLHFIQASTNHLSPVDDSTDLSNISIPEENVYNTLINLDTFKAMGLGGLPPVALLLKCASVL